MEGRMPAVLPARASDEALCQADIMTEVGQYTLRLRKRASFINTLGRVPDRHDFGAPQPELFTASSPAPPQHRALKRYAGQVAFSLDTRSCAA